MSVFSLQQVGSEYIVYVVYGRELLVVFLPCWRLGEGGGMCLVWHLEFKKLGCHVCMFVEQGMFEGQIQVTPRPPPHSAYWPWKQVMLVNVTAWYWWL